MGTRGLIARAAHIVGGDGAVSSWWPKRKKRKRASDPKMEAIDAALERMTKTTNGTMAESSRLRTKLAQIKIDVAEKEQAAIAAARDSNEGEDDDIENRPSAETG